MTSGDWFNRLALTAAGILGATGLAAAAGAGHGGDTRLLGALALVALTQAAALLALALAPATGRLLRTGAILIGAGACLFSADLAVRTFFGVGLFPMAAPVGGSATIAGWLVLAAAGALGRWR